MEHPGFFERAGPFSLADIATATGAKLGSGADPIKSFKDVRPLSDATVRDLSFLDNRKYLSRLSETHAGACLVLPAFGNRVPTCTAALLTSEPYCGFARALNLFYPDALRPKVAGAGATVPIDTSAELEAGVVVEPGAVIGPQAQIGQGTRIAAGAVVGYRVAIGRDCYIGAQATVTHALLGDRVIVHAGARIGQDGFRFAMGVQCHFKVAQIGRVLIQDDVEIGANSTVDRGALKDTIIGEGTKIDNLVQIGHNVIVGGHCVIVDHTGISGSTELGDFVVMGGQSGAVGHIKVGSGARIAGASHPKEDVPAGARVGGTPARPLKQWARELAVLTRMAGKRDKQSGRGGAG